MGAVLSCQLGVWRYLREGLGLAPSFLPAWAESVASQRRPISHKRVKEEVVESIRR